MKPGAGGKTPPRGTERRPGVLSCTAASRPAGCSRTGDAVQKAGGRPESHAGHLLLQALKGGAVCVGYFSGNLGGKHGSETEVHLPFCPDTCVSKEGMRRDTELTRATPAHANLDPGRRGGLCRVVMGQGNIQECSSSPTSGVLRACARGGCQQRGGTCHPEPHLALPPAFNWFVLLHRVVDSVLLRAEGTHGVLTITGQSVAEKMLQLGVTALL